MHPFKCVRRVYESHLIVIFAYITVGLESNAIHVSLNQSTKICSSIHLADLTTILCWVERLFFLNTIFSEGILFYSLE